MARKKGPLYRALKLLSRYDTGEVIPPGQIMDLRGWGRTPDEIAALIVKGAVVEVEQAEQVEEAAQGAPDNEQESEQ